MYEKQPEAATWYSRLGRPELNFFGGCLAPARSPSSTVRRGRRRNALDGRFPGPAKERQSGEAPAPRVDCGAAAGIVK